jgi:hypothetical protein
MAEAHVVSALRLKRAEISRHIHDLEKRIARSRVTLANLDATFRLSQCGQTGAPPVSGHEPCKTWPRLPRPTGRPGARLKVLAGRERRKC